MSLELFLLILSHVIFAIIGYLLHSSIHRHIPSSYTNTIVQTQAVESKQKLKEISSSTVEKIKKIHIDTSKVVVNDIDNDFEKKFDTLGNNTVQRDNIEQVVNKLSQLKNNGGDNG